MLSAFARSTNTAVAALWTAGLFAGGLLLSPHAAVALEVPTTDDLPALPPLFHTLEGSFAPIWDIVVTAAGIVFMVLLLIGGMQYLTSAGNEESTKKARALLLDAVIGIALVLIAWPIGRYAIDKLGLDTSIKISDASTISKVLNSAGGYFKLTMKMLGGQPGKQVQLRSVKNKTVNASPIERLGLIESASAEAASFDQTATTVANATTGEIEAHFTAPTDIPLEVLYDGEVVTQVSYPCSAPTLSLAPTGKQQPVATTLTEWLVPRAQAATNPVTREDDNFSVPIVPGTSSTLENSTQNQGSGGVTVTPEAPPSNQTKQNNDGSGTVQQACASHQVTVEVTRRVSQEVLVRVAVLENGTTPLKGVRVVAASNDHVPAAVVTNELGHAPLYVKPGQTYTLSLLDAPGHTIGSLVDRTHVAPTSPLGEATDPAVVWILPVKAAKSEVLVKVTFRMLDTNGKPLTGKKLYVSQLQGDLDGSFNKPGNFNEGNPVKPDSNGEFTVSLPVGQRVAVQYYSISRDDWFYNDSDSCRGQISKELADRKEPLICTVYDKFSNIYPAK